MTEQGRVAVVRVIARLNVGGPAQHVLHLTRELEPEFPTLLVAGSVSPGEVEIPIGDGVRLARIPQLGRRIRALDDVSAFLQLLRIIRQTRPLIVHTHTAKAGALARVAAALAGVPIRIHTYHGHVFTGYFGRIGSALAVTVERTLARLTTRILAVSDSQKHDLTRRFRVTPADRVSVVPLGVRLQPFLSINDAQRRAARAELGLSTERVVAIVGRLVPIKNHRLFLMAAAQVLANMPDAVFLIVGDGPEQQALRAYAQELGIATQVRFLGWRLDLHHIYAATDVVALSSDNEGTPVALIEALAAGKPVVATDVGGVADVLEQGRLGRLVPCGDAGALADGLIAALQEPTHTDHRAHVCERFGVERLVRDMKAVYRSVLPGDQVESPSIRQAA